MGYPPSGRGYRVRSLKTNHFFDSSSVIFDENVPYRAHHETSPNLVDYFSLPFPKSVLHSATDDTTSTPIPPLTPLIEAPQSPELDPAPTSPTTPPVPSSGPATNLRQMHRMTEAGRDYADSVCAAKVHLDKLKTNAEKRRELRAAAEKFVRERAAMLAERARMQPTVKEVEDVDGVCSFACLCREGAFVDLPDSDDVDVTAFAASLDVQDYLQRDADSHFETAFLSLRSDIIHDPRSPGYNMATPPANHREAMLRSDAAEG
jgi:hypothetical protein